MVVQSIYSWVHLAEPNRIALLHLFSGSIDFGRGVEPSGCAENALYSLSVGGFPPADLTFQTQRARKWSTFSLSPGANAAHLRSIGRPATFFDGKKLVYVLQHWHSQLLQVAFGRVFILPNFRIFTLVLRVGTAKIQLGHPPEIAGYRPDSQTSTGPPCRLERAFVVRCVCDRTPLAG